MPPAAVGLDATWIPEQPETPQDEDPPRRDSSAVPEAEAAAAAAEAGQGGAGRRPVRKAALAHRLWQTSEVEGDGKHPKQRRKRVQCAKRAAQGQPGARLVPPASRSPSAEASEGAAAGAASASASASALTEGLEQAASQGQGRTQGQGRKRQLPAQDAGAVQSPHPSKRPASPESAQSPAPPSAMAAAAFGIVPPVHAQQLAAAVFEAAAPWPSSGSGSTVQPLADAWPRMLAAAAYGAAPLQQQLGALPPHAFAAPGAASDPPTEAGLLQVLLQQQAQPSPAQLQPAQWAGWLAHGAPLPQLAAALPPGQLAMLGPVAPLGAAQQPAWGGRHQMPLMAVMSAGPPQPQPQEQLALQQLAAARLQQGQLQQHLEAQQRFEMRRQVEAQLRAAGLIAPGQLQAGVPIRLAALAPTAPAATVRPPTPHASQLQQAAMQPAGPPQSAMSPRRAAAHQMGGAVALLPPGWSVPTQQPWPAYTAGSSGSPAPGSADVQRFREQQLELERRAQQYQHEYNQAQQYQHEYNQAQQAQQAQHVQHPEQQQQRRRQQQQHQVPSPFAAYAAILPPDLQWQPQQAQAGGTAAATRDLAHPTVPHHTLSADLHMLFSAYADGQLSMPLPQGGPF